MGVDSVSPKTSLALRAPPLPWTRPPSFGETAPGVNKLEQVTASRAPSRSSEKHTHTPHSHQPSSLQRTVWGVGGGLESGGGTPRASSPRCGRLCPNPTVLGMCRKEPKAAGREASRTAAPRTRPGTHQPHRLLPEGWPFVPGCSQVLRHPEPSGRALQPSGEFWSAPGKFPARGCSPPGGRLSEPRGRVGSGLRSGLGPGTRTHTPGAEQLPKVSPLLRAAGVPPAPSASAPLPAGRAALNCSQFAEGGVLSWTLRETKQPKTAPS